MKATGVDIGASGIKIVQVEGTIKKAKVTAFVDHRFDPEATPRLDPESLGRLLEKLFRKHKIKPEGIVASVPAAHCLIREIQVPFTKDEQIRKTIKFQAESAFHSVQIDDMVVEHYKVEEFGNKSRLIVLALKKAIVEARLEAFQAADMDPRFLDIDVIALFNAFMASRAAANNARTMLVDLGAGSLKMCVIEDGRIRAVRSLRANAAGVKVDAGSDGTSRKMPKTLDELRAGLLAEEREDTFFADEGPLPVVILDEDQSELFDFEVEETRQSVLEKIFFEIDRTLVRTILSGPIEQIIVTGGGSKAKGISEAFTQHFEAPCEELPLSSAAAPRLKGSKKADYELVGATALGLALKGIGVDLSLCSCCSS
ncbi:MAG: pilus assembly protein PilM [Planctomycetota bacterium]|jgi:type IV pilus assembly protein PilM